jgi:hypothetical protein
MGPKAETELRAALRGSNKAVNQLFKTKKLDRSCQPDGSACQPISARDFYAAVVIGDFYDAAAVPDLLAAAARPALPSYYLDDRPSPNTQHNAIYDSLRKIGAAAAASPVRNIWTRGKDLPSQILAVSAYPFLARDDSGVAALGKIAGDNAADDSLRQEAATAFARLAHDAKAIAMLDALAKRYFDAAAQKRKEADGKPKADADAADKEYETAKRKLDGVKAELLKTAHDPQKSTDEIKAATAHARLAEDDFKDARRKYKDATLPYKQLDSASKAYKGYARMFQSHIARIEIAIRCKNDLACYGASLELTRDEAAKNCAPYIKDLGEWSVDEKQSLLEGNIERAMLELGKRGAKAIDQTDALLAAASSDNRIIRQSVLLALPKLAKLPCASCVTKLDAAIKAGEGKTALADLNLETTVLRNYFVWAGQP